MVIDKKCRICRDKCGIYRLPNRCATHRTTTKAWQITLVCMKRPRRDTNGEGEFKVNETSPPHKARAYWTDNGFWCTPFTSTPMPSRDECHCCLLLMANHAIGGHLNRKHHLELCSDLEPEGAISRALTPAGLHDRIHIMGASSLVGFGERL